jgi:hypothetical protein
MAGTGCLGSLEAAAEIEARGKMKDSAVAAIAPNRNAAAELRQKLVEDSFFFASSSTDGFWRIPIEFITQTIVNLPGQSAYFPLLERLRGLPLLSSVPEALPKRLEVLAQSIEQFQLDVESRPAVNILGAPKVEIVERQDSSSVTSEEEFQTQEVFVP